MSRSHSHLNTAKVILESFRNEIPLHAYLKNFFSTEKKYGSRDRKTIASLCYYYFRLGHAENLMSVEERILTGIFLCENDPNKVLEDLKPEWNEKIGLPLQQKLLNLENFYPANIFLWGAELSEGIEAGTYSLSFLLQPKLFLRIRPGYDNKVVSAFKSYNTNFEIISKSCIALSIGVKVDDVIDINKEAVIQDYSSQRVGELLQAAFSNIAFTSAKVWDCCAASGGKSILAYDIQPTLQLTVSDVRPTILHNLRQRFKEACIKNFRPVLTDLANSVKLKSAIGTEEYDLIICDAPCSGSGTRSRTPEQLYYFKQGEIEKFSALQKAIVTNITKHLAEGGQLLYITCSVFKKENEEVVAFIEDTLQLKLIRSELFKGYPLQADTMFVALFIKQ